MEDDWLEIPGLHDSVMEGLHMSPENDLRVDFRTLTGGRLALEIDHKLKPVVVSGGVVLPAIIGGALWLHGPTLDHVYHREPVLANMASYICRHPFCLEISPVYGSELYIFMNKDDPDSIRWNREED